MAVEQISARRRLSKITSRVRENHVMVLSSWEALRRDNSASESIAGNQRAGTTILNYQSFFH
jgi:hypothetical protein